MNDKPTKIKVKYLTKKFELLQEKNSKNKIKSLAGVKDKNKKDFWALRNVNFEMKDGECVGIIGLNGAGKSTLSNIISGQTFQTTGDVEINGDVSIIAANAGMQNNLSGRENIRLKGLMLGMTNKEIKEKMHDIIEFSELGPFIDQPVKTYSSGMKAKLGFSIMVHQNPDIMIIDEGLSVGDKAFVDKSKKKMFEFREQGKTILLVSHDMRTIREWCDRVIWLSYGEVRAYGEPEKVVAEYEEFVKNFKKLSKKEQKAFKNKERQAQFDYSLAQLEQTTIDLEPTNTRLSIKQAKRKIQEKKDSHNLSWGTKLLLLFCVLGVAWSSLLAMSDTTVADSFKHPRSFLLEHTFKDKDKDIVTNKINKPVSLEEQYKLSKTQYLRARNNYINVRRKYTSTKPMNGNRNIRGIYKVKSGDSVKDIIGKYGITSEELKRANPKVDLTTIFPGQSLRIPKKKANVQNKPVIYIVKQGDSIENIINKYGVTSAELKTANSDLNLNVIYPGQKINIPQKSNK